MRHKDFIEIHDYSADEVRELFETARDMKRQPQNFRRALEGPSPRPSSGRPDVPARGYNAGADESFNLITHVVPKLHDPARHGAYAQRVARQAERMRRFLLQLGLGLTPQRLRVQGKSLDRSRIRALVTRGEPMPATAPGPWVLTTSCSFPTAKAMAAFQSLLVPWTKGTFSRLAALR